MSSACSRRSCVSRPTEFLMISNWPVTTRQPVERDGPEHDPCDREEPERRAVCRGIERQRHRHSVHEDGEKDRGDEAEKARLPCGESEHTERDEKNDDGKRSYCSRPAKAASDRYINLVPQHRAPPSPGRAPPRRGALTVQKFLVDYFFGAGAGERPRRRLPHPASRCRAARPGTSACCSGGSAAANRARHTPGPTGTRSAPCHRPSSSARLPSSTGSRRSAGRSRARRA